MNGRQQRLVVALAMLPVLWGPCDGALADSRPNMILILADDLGWGDLGCYGQKQIKTPHIDKLAHEGMRFTQAYAGAPVCTPSRSVLMTGLHNGHTPARDNVPHYHTYLRNEDLTIAEVLRKGGYRCGGVGKWSLGDAGTVGRATNQGFDTWFGYLNQDHAHYYYPDYLDDDEARLELAGNGRSRRHYSHDLIVDRALSFIAASRHAPFFLYAAFTLPHFSAEEEDADRFAVPSTVPYTHRDWSEKAKKYAAMVHRLDEAVGRIAMKVDALELSRQTLIIFTSDNGGHQAIGREFDTNGPLRGYKRHLTEGGLRVPFVARWPGTVPAGRVCDEVVAFQDMLPTFAELAGFPRPTGLDGTSVVGALRGGRVKHAHEYLYWDYGHCRSRYDQAVRLGPWKGIRLGRGSALKLYHLDADIGEEHDVSGEHPAVVQRIEGIMRAAVTPSPRYPIGELYQGQPIWRKD